MALGEAAGAAAALAVKGGLSSVKDVDVKAIQAEVGE
jgi:hypothetical protein